MSTDIFCDLAIFLMKIEHICSTSVAVMEFWNPGNEINFTANNKMSSEIEKKYRYCIKGTACSWLSWLNLEKRYQSICRKENDKLDLMKVTCGVPQGSMLCPKLFLFIILKRNYLLTIHIFVSELIN